MYKNNADDEISHTNAMKKEFGLHQKRLQAVYSYAMNIRLKLMKSIVKAYSLFVKVYTMHIKSIVRFNRRNMDALRERYLTSGSRHRATMRAMEKKHGELSRKEKELSRKSDEQRKRVEN